ncbi:PREDICTED: glutamate receptor 3.1-like [Camelina sativa]|uniref:Glutamate receptor 3.1-like n=1 Tax=Camelina sativa TaxID=90675 RepID=A0ABM1QIJ9_CAMSA|nr:PREDICTED: glutamate receptor 3.1-like [Camelina sativa]
MLSSMNLVLLSFFIIVLGSGLLLLSEGASSSSSMPPPVIKVGAIFGLNTMYGETANLAFKAAEEDVNSDPSFLGGTKLQIMMNDAKRSGFLSIMGALQFMETDAVAIIGPQTSIMAHVLSHLANELTVPMLSFTALDPTLSPLQFPYFVQTAPSDLFLMRAVADMITYYGWSDVVALYNDDDNSRNGVTALGDELEERRCRISYKAVLPLDVVISSPVEIIEELIKIRGMESRVIVVNTFPNTGNMIFKEAERLGMMEKGYVWIATTWLTSLLDSKYPLDNRLFNGVLTLRLHTPDSRKKRDFAARWKNKLSNNNKTIGLNVYGLYAYDTVWIIARAVKALLEAGGNLTFSNHIMMNDAKRSGFLSIMGALQFMETDAVAIIGPQTSIMAHVLSHLANELTVPMLSFTALDPTLSPLQFPYFVQTAPSDLFLMRAVADMITYYGWSDVVALYNDDDNSRNGVTALGDELEERRCRISYKAVLPLDVVISSPVEIIEELIKIRGMESRVIVVNTFPNTGNMIFKEAERLGMMEKGYVWIATTWLTSLLDSKYPLDNRLFNGVLTLRLHTPDSRKKRDFAARWKNKLSNNNKTIGLNVYGLYAYDTVWIIARAVKALLEAGDST